MFSGLCVKSLGALNSRQPIPRSSIVTINGVNNCLSIEYIVWDSGCVECRTNGVRILRYFIILLV